MRTLRYVGFIIPRTFGPNALAAAVSLCRKPRMSPQVYPSPQTKLAAKLQTNHCQQMRFAVQYLNITAKI